MRIVGVTKGAVQLTDNQETAGQENGRYMIRKTKKQGLVIRGKAEKGREGTYRVEQD